MLKALIAGSALAIAILPGTVSAQTGAPAPQPTQVQPTSPNSGAGIPGQPGNKNGPAAKSEGTTGAGSGSGVPQDASKIPGKPGSKSGPTQTSPSKK